MVKMASGITRGCIRTTTATHNMTAKLQLIGHAALVGHVPIFDIGNPFMVNRHLLKQGIRSEVTFFVVNRWPTTGFSIGCGLKPG